MIRAVKKLINAVDAVVPDLLSGLVARSPGLALLDGHSVVVRSDFDELRQSNAVAIISGGGAGHEPAHGGFVGPGMLTAAVVGEVFTSPSVDSVLATLSTVGGPAGVLMIVKNYTGDRLNFGLAGELARAAGIDVEMVVVSDDVALAADGAHAGRRGIAGTVLVHKAAGAAAARGANLAEVTAMARAMAEAVGTMGVALSACTVPSVGRPGFDLDEGEVEWGLGIHGEPGVEKSALSDASESAERLVASIVDDRSIRAGDRVVVLVNNLGSTPPSELDIVTVGVLAALDARGIVVENVWTGTFLTALDMSGVSVSIAKIDEAALALLEAPATTSAWPSQGSGRVEPRPRIDVRADADVPAIVTSSPTVPNSLASSLLETVCEALLAAEDELSRLDSIVGDGDLGFNLARGARQITSEIPGYPASPAALLRAVAATVRRVVGGTSGPLYAIMLLRAAAELDAVSIDGVGEWVSAAEAGIAAVSELGGAQVGDRTMLDALVPFVTTLREGLATGMAQNDAMRRALVATAEGVSSTALVAARAGRASYLGDRAKGTPDPGARAVEVWLNALVNRVTGVA